MVYVAWYDDENENTYNAIIGIYTTEQLAKDALINEIKNEHFELTQEEIQRIKNKLIKNNWKCAGIDCCYYFGITAMELNKRQPQYLGEF